MRALGLTLTTLVLAGVVLARQPAAAPPADNAALDRYLLSWEKSMESINTLFAQVKRTEKDTTLDSKQVLVGKAYFKRSGKGANAVNKTYLQMSLEGKEEIAEKFICTGSYAYQFLPAEKKIKYFEVPRPKLGQESDGNFLTFPFRMKAEQAKKRYDLHLAKEDKDFVYMDILPRTREDKEDFVRAQVVLSKETFLPCQLYFVSANRSETIWNVSSAQKNVVLNERIFDAPRKPDGWKLEPGQWPEPAPSRIVPNNGR
jgi:TIGR03009 family protein